MVVCSGQVGTGAVAGKSPGKSLPFSLAKVVGRPGGASADAPLNPAREQTKVERPGATANTSELQRLMRETMKLSQQKYLGKVSVRVRACFRACLRA